MGRSAVREVVEAVPVPHDGPTYWLQRRENDDKPDVAARLKTKEGVARALDILSGFDCSDIMESDLSPTRRLWKNLLGADQIRTQLQALQAYRSTLLHHLRRRSSEEEASNEQSEQEEWAGSYRILLEWSLSAGTPSALRRAIQSSLDALSSLLHQSARIIRQEVVLSLFENSLWTNPVGSLFEGLSYGPTKQVIIQNVDNSFSKALMLLVHESDKIEPILEQHSFNNMSSSGSEGEIPKICGQDAVDAIEKSLNISVTLKLMLTPILSSGKGDELSIDSYDETSNASMMAQLESFLWHVITCRATNSDGLSATGVTYAQTLLFKWRKHSSSEEAPNQEGGDPDAIAAQATSTISQLTNVEDANGLSDLNILAVVQGVAATLPNEIIVRGSPSPILFDPLASFILGQCQHATEAAVRLSALRGLDTLLSKCQTILKTITDESFCSHVQSLTQDTMESVLQTWESPPGRQVESAIPSLFQSLIGLLQALPPYKDGGGDGRRSSLDLLVRRVLSQPPNRKGRYLALETLLPVVGAKVLISMGGDSLIASLVSGIGDRGHNAGAIADLLGKLLSRLRQEMNVEAGIANNSKAINKKRRRKMERAMAKGESVGQAQDKTKPQLLPAWINEWAPHVACALLSPTAIRRKQVAAFCIPLLVDIVGGPTRRTDAAYAFAALLDELTVQYDTLRATGCDSFEGEVESLSDRLVWAKLEIARQASLQKLTNKTTSTSHLRNALATHLPLDDVRSSLTHSAVSIRLVAFSALEAVVSTYDSCASPLEMVTVEMQLWRFALPYAFKSGEKEYAPKLLQCLTSLLNRVSLLEADALDASKDHAVQLEALAISEGTTRSTLPLFSLFVCDFLIDTLVLKQAAYPGTVAEKEGFALPLLQCILAFAAQDGVLSADNKPRAKSGTAPKRRLSSCQEEANVLVIRKLQRAEVFATLLSLLHSMWDKTRAAAYACMCNLVRQAHVRKLPLPAEVSSDECRASIEARSIHLTSSPRQREADSGARMLAFLYTTFPPEKSRIIYLQKLVNMAVDRVTMMEEVLGLVLSQNDGNNNSNRSTAENQSMSQQHGDGRDLPLAHGLIHALRLVVDFLGGENASSERQVLLMNDLFEQMASVCCRSIQVSLAVVADVKEGETVDGVDSEFGLEAIDHRANRSSEQAPLNVNTGAIGANASFSSVKAADEDETVRRFAIQRIVVGSWLLTKESCSALASIMTSNKFRPPRSLVAKAGELLISTLTSLKHQGAAFAAHKVLQQIASSCSNPKSALRRDETTASLPVEWVQRLLAEISETEKVRDSTLRRSTGYGLLALSIMRSEPPSSVAPRTLCPYVLANLVQLSLPSESEMASFMKRYRFEMPENDVLPFAFPSVLGLTVTSKPYVSDREYESRSRVHALNILRLAILDAPLASEVSRFIGDAIMTAVIGYNDSTWAVRNSATMVFAAAMLRVVDADKNASRKDLTSGNAVTARELFRTYPVLSPFLLSVVEEGVEDMRAQFAKGASTSRLYSQMSPSRLIHPPLYPVLLLLSRLQPVVLSGVEAIALTEPFVPVILECLGHRHHKVRIVAARSLANICAGENNRESSRLNLLKCCHSILTKGMIGNGQPVNGGWNARHGALLGIQTLLMSSSDPRQMLTSSELLPGIYHYASWWQGSCWCPPSCVSVALEILHDVAESGEFVEKAEEASGVVVSRIDEISKTRGGEDLIGMSRLGAVASRVACSLSLKKIWDPSVDGTLRTFHLGKLAAMFQSNVIDIRLEAVKAFKKPIYGAIDNLMVATDITRDQKVAILASVSRVLYVPLSVEVMRDNQEVPDDESSQPVGRYASTHPPTVRRLSRCLLECMYAYRSLLQGGEDDIASSHSITMEDLWDTCCNILNVKDGVIGEKLDDANALCGNALELMAFAVCTWLSRYEKDLYSNALLAKAGLFVRAVVRLNDPLSSWRLRHCAARAIETSQLLLWRSMDGGMGTEDTDAKLQELQLDLFVTSLMLLQDSDLDVRSVAGRAVTRASLRKGKETSRSVPLLILEQMCAYANRRFPPADFIKRLLTSILDGIGDLEENKTLFLREIGHSEDLQSSTGLLNLSTSRKIFEDEDPNPFEERLLANHITVWTMAHSLQQLDSDDPIQNEMMARCYSNLALIQQRSIVSKQGRRYPDIVHEITRSNRIFPAIHSLLVGCIAIRFLGGDDTHGVQQAAQSIVESSSKEGAVAIHPCIMEALQVLAIAKPRDPSTYEGLMRCCFLLPGCVNPDSS